MRHLLFAVCILLGLAPLGAAAAERVVLVADPWCPHTCEPGPAPGYMIEIASRALALHGIEVEYRVMPWVRAMAEVGKGKADGAVGALKEEADAAGLVSHREPLGRQANAFAARADDPWTFAGLASLKGRRVGSILGYSYSQQIDTWLEANKAQVHAIGGENALDRNLSMLAAGRVDVVVEDAAVLAHRLKERPDRASIKVAGRAEGGDLFIALTAQGGRGKRLATLLDQGIQDLRASGALRAILATYGLGDWKP